MANLDQNKKKSSLDSILNENILSGEQLFAYRKLTDRSVPQRGGQKEYAPDNSWLQETKLERFYEERREVLSEERVEAVGNVVHGEWIPEKGLIEIKNLSGKFWIHMGFEDEKRKWLFPEEALYLMETNILLVEYGGVPISIHQAYACFMQEACSLEEYQVYSHLCRLGYVVIRHSGPIELTPYVKKIKLDKHIKRKRPKVSEKGDNQEGSSSIDGQEYEPVIKQAKLGGDNMGENDEIVEEGNDVPMLEVEEERHDIFEESVNLMRDIGKCTDCGLAKTSSCFIQSPSANSSHTVPFSDFSTILLPDIGQAGPIELCKLNDELFCGKICDSEKITILTTSYKTDMRKRASKKFKEKQDQESYLSNLDFSYSEIINWRKHIKARNWREYKEAVAYKLKADENVEEKSPLEHLWSEDVIPLVKPEDAKSTARVLEKLQVIQSTQLTKDASDLPGNHLKISYDVYLPYLNFKKSSPGYPNHRVAVMRISDGPPSLATIIKTISLYKDDVPVNVAVVDNGQLSFYNFKDFCIPVDIPVG